MSHSLQVLCANAENVECFIYRKDKALFLQTCGLNVICNSATSSFSILMKLIGVPIVVSIMCLKIFDSHFDLDEV